MKKIKKLINELNLNYKKEKTFFLMGSLISILLAVIAFLFHQLVVSIILLFGPLFILIIKYWQYTTLKDKNTKNHEDEFINLITYLEIFISNKFNIYNSFLEVKAYSSPWMSDKIQILLEEIDNDKTVDPFVHFATNFKTPIVENVMVAIFQMVEEGESSNQLNQFDILFQRFSENHHLSRINQKIRKLDGLSSLPLIGAGLVVIILTFGILTIMGDIINVI